MQTPPTNKPEPFPIEPIPPDLLAWAKQTFDVKEHREGVREIQATGGHSLDAVVAEVEARVRPS